MKLMKIGKIVNTFGIKGELKVLSDSEFVDERFKVGSKIYLKNEEELTISAFRYHNSNILIKVNDKNDINEVEKYKNSDIFVDQNKLEPLENEFYLFQLEDLDVYQDDKYLGKVIEVFKPAQTILRVECVDREILIPFVKEFIVSTDLENKRINVKLLEGM